MRVELREKYSDLPKISRLSAASVVVVCATKTKEAQTWQRNGQTVKATSASARMDAGRVGIFYGDLHAFRKLLG